MVNKCVVNTCNTVKAGDGVTMHQLPADPVIRNVWFRALLDKTGQTVFREEDEICSKHFNAENFEDVDGIAVLKDDAVPFNFCPDDDEAPRAKRSKRSETVPSQCSVFSCTNVSNETLLTQPNLTYYPFPKSKVLLTSWKQFCNKTDDNFSQSFVCSDHFTANDFTNVTETSTGSDSPKVLKPNAVPSIYKSEIKCEELIEEGEEVITPQNVLQMDFTADDNNLSMPEDKICGIENCDYKTAGRNDVEYYPTSTKKTTTKSLRQTNKRQLQHLADFMIQNTDLARGLLNTSQGAHKSKDLWYTISKCLNAFGPPIKTVNEWQKVWRDQKYLTKKKLSNNLRLNKNGSCSYEQQPLSAVEEAFIEAADLEAAVLATEATNQSSTSSQNVSNNHSIQDFNFEPKVGISTLLGDDISIICNTEEDVSDAESEVKVKQKRFSKTDFMKTYCDTMKSIDSSLKELVTNVNSIVKYNEEQAVYRNKMIQIKKAGLALKKEKWIEKRNIALEKLKQKEELMELERQIKTRKLKKLEMSK